MGNLFSCSDWGKCYSNIKLLWGFNHTLNKNKCIKLKILDTNCKCSPPRSGRNATVALLPGEQGKRRTWAETSLAGAGQQTPVGHVINKKTTIQYAKKIRKVNLFAILHVNMSISFIITTVSCFARFVSQPKC